MSRKIRNRPIVSKKNEYALVADGETEQWYIKQFKEYYKVSIKITPELPQTKSLKEQYNLIENFVKEKSYKKILWIIDLDTILKEIRESKKAGQTLSEFKKLYNDAITTWIDQVTVIINNPCLEYWYCMHNNYNLNSFFESYDKMLPTLRKYTVNNQLFSKYNKSKKDDYLSGKGLFLNLLPDLKKFLSSKAGTQNGTIDFSKLRTFDPDKCETEGCSEMWKLFEFFKINPEE